MLSFIFMCSTIFALMFSHMILILEMGIHQKDWYWQWAWVLATTAQVSLVTNVLTIVVGNISKTFSKQFWKVHDVADYAFKVAFLPRRRLKFPRYIKYTPYELYHKSSPEKTMLPDISPVKGTRLQDTRQKKPSATELFLRHTMVTVPPLRDYNGELHTTSDFQKDRKLPFDHQQTQLIPEATATDIFEHREPPLHYNTSLETIAMAATPAAFKHDEADTEQVSSLSFLS